MDVNTEILMAALRGEWGIGLYEKTIRDLVGTDQDDRAALLAAVALGGEKALSGFLDSLAERRKPKE